MATPLFINRTDLVRNSIIDGNVDTAKFIYFIKISQTIHIQNFLGTELYQKFEELITAGTLTDAANPTYYNLMITYIQPMLIWYAQVDYIPFAAYQIKNGGVFKHTSENSESATKEELDYFLTIRIRLALFLDHGLRVEDQDPYTYLPPYTDCP